MKIFLDTADTEAIRKHFNTGLVDGLTTNPTLIRKSGRNHEEVYQEVKDLKQESDPKELEKLIEKVINKNQDKVKEYKSGKEKLFGFFVGQVMKDSGGKANPQLVNEILKKKLK